MTSIIKESKKSNKYELSDSFYYNPYSKKIGVGGKYKLTPVEEIAYTADALTHEHIHKVLCEMFNVKTSALFDIIGDKEIFRNTPLHKKVILYEKDGSRLWSEAIKCNGIQCFYMRYCISCTDLILINYICNHRKQNHFIQLYM